MPLFHRGGMGISDMQCIWLGQMAGREMHWIDYIEDRGKPLSHYAKSAGPEGQDQWFLLSGASLPHDVEARELETGKSRQSRTQPTCWMIR